MQAFLKMLPVVLHQGLEGIVVALPSAANTASDYTSTLDHVP